jgi:hypothetical protein
VIREPRTIDEDSTDPQHVIATALALYNASDHIRPRDWWQAGRAVRALKAKGLLTDRRRMPRSLARRTTPPVAAEIEKRG